MSLLPRTWTKAAHSTTAALLAGAGLLAFSSIVSRRLWARHLANRISGTKPGFKTSDGVLLHTEVAGATDSPLTVVMVHGFSASMQEYDGQRDVLAQHARVVLFDQRGHGKSGWGDFRSASIKQLGADLGAVIDEYAPEGPVVLVAHSMGGMAAISLAGQRPDLFGPRIKGAALISTTAGRIARAEMSERAANIALRSGLAKTLVWLLWFLGPVVDLVSPFRRSWGQRFLMRELFGTGEPPFWAVQMMQHMWIRTSQAIASAFYPPLLNYAETDSLGPFRRIPTLVLAGEADNTIPSRRSSKLAEDIGDQAELVLVSGAGHMVNLTHPRRVNQAILNLLHRIEPQGTQY